MPGWQRCQWGIAIRPSKGLDSWCHTGIMQLRATMPKKRTPTTELSPQLKAIGRRAAMARELCGMGQREAAESIGLPNSSLSRFEGGLRKLTLENLLALAELYRVPVGWLLADEVPLPPRGETTGVGDRRRRNG